MHTHPTANWCAALIDGACAKRPSAREATGVSMTNVVSSLLLPLLLPVLLILLLLLLLLLLLPLLLVAVPCRVPRYGAVVATGACQYPKLTAVDDDDDAKEEVDERPRWLRSVRTMVCSSGGHANRSSSAALCERDDDSDDDTGDDDDGDDDDDDTDDEGDSGDEDEIEDEASHQSNTRASNARR